MNDGTIVIIDDDEDYVSDFKDILEKRFLFNGNIVSNITFGEEVEKNGIDEFIDEIKKIISNCRDNVVGIFLDLAFSHSNDAWLCGYRIGDAIRIEFYDLPIIILTNYGESKIILEAFYHDYDAFIRKIDFANMDKEGFNGKLSQAINKRKAMVKNIPNYYKKHMEKKGIEPEFNYNIAFGYEFITRRNNLEKTLDNFSALEDYFAEQKRTTVIMFVDLVGSCEIKEKKSFVNGLLVTRFHNQKVTEIIKSFGGLIVKYIGDCVMARFDYDEKVNVNSIPINCAIKIMEKFKKDNKKSKRPDPIETKIGIAVGVVADFYGADPQGSTVDLAARLQSTAKPNEILVDSNLIRYINISTIKSAAGEVNYSDSNEYIVRKSAKLKGFKDEIEYYLILWQ